MEQAALNRSELHLTEYQSQDRYLADHPTGRAMGDHSNLDRRTTRQPGIVNLTGKEEFGVETDTDLEGMSRASGLVPELKRFAEQLAITVC